MIIGSRCTTGVIGVSLVDLTSILIAGVVGVTLEVGVDFVSATGISGASGVSTVETTGI